MEVIDILVNILSVFGSLGLFLYGMKLMSESLQKVAGERLRRTLSALTYSRFRGILAGFFITGLIQSSSATTVMLVSFVNAGLLTVTKSIGIIMGANIGTTVTAWLVLVGFQIPVNILILPVIGLAFPLFFSRNNKHRIYGELVIGIALLFLGLDFLKETLPNIANNPEYFARFSDLPHSGLWPLLLFTFFGMVITIIIQSSSATMTLTMVLCSNGWIPLEMGAAMVLGENIGTTITPNIAALIANNKAKQSARIHFLFNTLALLWALPLFYPFIHGIEWLIGNYSETSIEANTATILFSLAIFHTSFNIINTMIMMNFTGLLYQLSTKLVSWKNENNDNKVNLKFINTSLLSTTELSTIQAKNEIGVFARRLRKMFGFIPILLIEKKDTKYEQLLDRISKYEKITDHMEIEISSYLTHISESEMSLETSYRVRVMLKIIDDLENIGDMVEQMARTIDNKNKNKVWFTQDIRDSLNILFTHLNHALVIMEHNLNNEYSEIEPEDAFKTEEKINTLRDQMRQKHAEMINDNTSHQAAGSYFNDLYSMGEKIGDHVVNVTEVIYHHKNMLNKGNED
ncbi:MAG: Na/Pi cotransporter family protein [Bacteroidales bacterium]|nr:Na/Pi cotransporter family protein [Bacteroidales bacterium]